MKTYLGPLDDFGMMEDSSSWRPGNFGKDLAAEILRVQQEDEKRMRVALGLEEASDDENKFTKDELKAMTEKIK